MRKNFYIALFLCLVSISVFAQNNVRLYGNIFSDTSVEGKILYFYGAWNREISVKIIKNSYSVVLPYKHNEEIIVQLGNDKNKICYVLITKPLKLKYNLDFRIRKEALKGITISADRNKSDKRMRFLRDVEGGMVLVGKKSSVAMLGKMLINKASNNPRQMFREVSGIVIQESGDGGLQLNIGARGLNPNRSANFSMRQNGYDISADPLGYPECYYSPNADDISEIQVVRGASALQYGSQFGGMVNFKLDNAPKDKKLEVRENLSYGSYKFINSYTRFSGTLGKFSYYLSSTLRRGDGYRPNSDFKTYNILSQFRYNFNPYSVLSLDILKYHYIEHQPGGLTDVMFLENPRQSNRKRNWFYIDWNILSLGYKWSSENGRTQFNTKAVGLYATRKALGYRDKRVSTPDPGNIERDLQVGLFRNIAIETRLIQRLSFTSLSSQSSVLLIGTKYYQSDNYGRQGAGSKGFGPDFEFMPAPNSAEEFIKDKRITYRSFYRYPNLNLALFSEFALKVGNHLTIVPGLRYEYIKTGIFGHINHYSAKYKDGHDNLIIDERLDTENFPRNVLLAGISISYKISKAELYANLTQNYRAITFNDLRTVRPALSINPNIKDESGFSSDIGFRSRGNGNWSYDLSLFCLYYGNRIGEYFRENPLLPGAFERYRDNIGDGISYGVEFNSEYELNSLTKNLLEDWTASIFGNMAITQSKYVKVNGGYDVRGNRMEFVPFYNIKAGINSGYKKISASFQLAYTSYQFTDALNQPWDLDDNTYGIYGVIPGYMVMDMNIGYNFNSHIKFNLSLHNLSNSIYMTRRATGYPGPGIIPSSPFNVMGTIQFKW